jgi:hypothetical protein
MYEGQDVVDLAMTREHQKYVLGAKVHLANRDWSGPWDCAEFVSWACYHAYKTVIAVRPPNIQLGESYSGWWQEDAVKLGGAIGVSEAIGTAGAILVRRPGYEGIKIGHVAISRGDNTTIEAHSSKVGVAVLPKANTRSWSTGFLVPGVSYGKAAKTPKIALPKGIVQLTSPYTRGPDVVAIQQALLKAGINPGPADGIFGNSTAFAVAAFQPQVGLLVDGVVGPQTRKALKV